MKRNWIWGLAIAAICLSPLLAAPCSAHASDMPETISLADLADGETRTFGEGDHAVTVTRKGDEVILTVRGEKGEKTLHFTVGKDSESVMTLNDEGGESKLVVMARPGHSGDGEGTFFITAGADESGHVTIHGAGPDATITTADVAGAGLGTKVIRIMTEGGTVLSCPEGDASLTLKKGEENTGPYFCPRHNLKMEPSKDPVLIKELVIDRKSKSKDDEY